MLAGALAPAARHKATDVRAYLAGLTVDVVVRPHHRGTIFVWLLDYATIWDDDPLSFGIGRPLSPSLCQRVRCRRPYRSRVSLHHSAGSQTKHAGRDFRVRNVRQDRGR